VDCKRESEKEQIDQELPRRSSINKETTEMRKKVSWTCSFPKTGKLMSALRRLETEMLGVRKE
jgi:hypothetical protein